MHTERDSINGNVSVISHETACGVPDPHTHMHTHINIVLDTAYFGSIRFMDRDCVSLILNVVRISVCVIEKEDGNTERVSRREMY